MKKPILSFLFIIVIFIPDLRAQLSPYFEFQYLYDDAVELFEKKKYGAAQKKVDAFLMAEQNLRGEERDNDLHANARFIQAVGAYHLDRNDAVSLMEQYIFEFDENTKASLMGYYLGKYHFDHQKYGLAIQPLVTAYNAGSLPPDQLTEAMFILAYAYFKEGNNAQAIHYFELVSTTENRYREDALYYRAVILYQDLEFEEAYFAFKDLTSSEKYGQETQVYLANTMLKLKKYDELYILADDLIARPRVKGKDAQIYYIVANASFERYDYPRTTEFFSQYVGNKGKMNRTDYFRYGFAHYKQDEFTEAVPFFQKAMIQIQTDSLTQVSSYYLGFCYLKLKDNDNAKIAFQKATQGDATGNPEISQDALYQYAKVAFATGDYSNALKGLTQIVETYPRATYIDEVQTMIGETYLLTRDYPRSIKYFESIPRNTPRAQKAYQLVCYYYGLDLYERGGFENSIPFFRKAISSNFDKDMALSAQYWLAEATYRNNDNKGALLAYNAYLGMSGVATNEYNANAYYGQGWAYFKEKNYTAARQAFDNFIQKGGRTAEKNLIVDAHLRAGDCLFLQRNYAGANTYYQKVVDFRYTQGDYAYYQLAEAAYRQSNYQKSVENFDKVIQTFRTSDLRDDALDRISEIYATWIKNNNQALKYAKMLVDEYPKSPLAADAYNRLALASYNAGDSDGAVRYFKKVLTDYASDKKNAQIALDNLTGLVSESEFDKILRDYRNQNPNMDTNLAQLVFNTGKDRFFAMNYSSAVDQFTTYINDYKNGPDYFEALVFRARAYRELGKFISALDDYKQIYTATVRNDFTNIALLEAAEIKYEQKDYTQSLQLYQTLDNQAGKLENKVQAKFGVAKSHKALGDYKLAQDALTQIANNNEVAVYSRTKAQVEIGHCQYLAGQLLSAKASFAKVEQEFKNAFGAESQYMLTKILFDEGKQFQAKGQNDLATGKFEEVKDAAIYMANNYSSFNYEKAKTFIVAASAYFELGNAFQAKGTLESLINEAPYDDVKEEARKILAEIQAKEEGN
ncbi:MAG: tetratricopeptide repeat protein [Bacteroidia bacterium]|nr:tetratricopeptide repeat protein [Bacteroidia bacterium]